MSMIDEANHKYFYHYAMHYYADVNELFQSMHLLSSCHANDIVNQTNLGKSVLHFLRNTLTNCAVASPFLKLLAPIFCHFRTFL